MADTFDKNYYLGNRQDADRPALKFYSRIAKTYLPPGRILDFGCGTGFFMRRLRAFTPTDGYDISDYARKSASELVPDAHIFSNTEDIPDNTYSGITALHVLEHLTDPELGRMFTLWERAMLPGGRILCVVPDLSGKGHALKKAEWFAFRDASHINLKGRDEWKYLFHSNGFTIHKIGTDGLWDFPYTSWAPKLIDAALHSIGTVVQFIRGELILSEGEGESSIFILER